MRLSSSQWDPVSSWCICLADDSSDLQRNLCLLVPSLSWLFKRFVSSVSSCWSLWISWILYLLWYSMFLEEVLQSTWPFSPCSTVTDLLAIWTGPSTWLTPSCWFGSLLWCCLSSDVRGLSLSPLWRLLSQMMLLTAPSRLCGAFVLVLSISRGLRCLGILLPILCLMHLSLSAAILQVQSL